MSEPDVSMLDDRLTVRVNTAELESFRDACRNRLKRDYSDIVREMITAYNERRLHITPTPEQKESYGELYNVD